MHAAAVVSCRARVSFAESRLKSLLFRARVVVSNQQMHGRVLSCYKIYKHEARISVSVKDPHSNGPAR
eukprot:5315568-Amphidinium_carterae.1